MDLTSVGVVQLCINRSVTFVCTVQAPTFSWTVGSILTGNDGVLSVGNNGALNTITRRMFTLTAESASVLLIYLERITDQKTKKLKHQTFQLRTVAFISGNDSKIKNK